MQRARGGGMRPKGRESEEWLNTSFTPRKAKSSVL